MPLEILHRAAPCRNVPVTRRCQRCGTNVNSKRPSVQISEILEYLRLEEDEDTADLLVPGSVKYVGAVENAGVLTHYWSYPAGDQLRWASLERDCLALANDVPDVVVQLSAPRPEHKIRRKTAAAQNAWSGSNLPRGTAPQWIPSSRIRTADVGFVAIFERRFEEILEKFQARASKDKHGGGAGPVHFFFLELAGNRLARLDWWERRPTEIELHLHVSRNGVVQWEDYDQIMDPLGIPLEQAFRQGNLKFVHRNPTPEDLRRTEDHFSRMWRPKR